MLVRKKNRLGEGAWPPGVACAALRLRTADLSIHQVRRWGWAGSAGKVSRDDAHTATNRSQSAFLRLLDRPPELSCFSAAAALCAAVCPSGDRAMGDAQRRLLPRRWRSCPAGGHYPGQVISGLNQRVKPGSPPGTVFQGPRGQLLVEVKHAVEVKHDTQTHTSTQDTQEYTGPPATSMSAAVRGSPCPLGSGQGAPGSQRRSPSACTSS